MKESELIGKVHSAVYHLVPAAGICSSGRRAGGCRSAAKRKIRGLEIREGAVSGSSLHVQFEETLFYYETDPLLCKEIQFKTVILLL